MQGHELKAVVFPDLCEVTLGPQVPVSVIHELRAFDRDVVVRKRTNLTWLEPELIKFLEPALISS